LISVVFDNVPMTEVYLTMNSRQLNDDIVVH
jgi:hypothetical protein